MEMRVRDGGCFCLFAFPIGRLDLCFCFGRSFAAGCPTPIFFLFSTSKVPVRNMMQV